jgi:hypothetical protein
MSEYQTTPETSRRSGSLVLAAALTILVGAFQIIVGLAVLGDKDFFQASEDYWYRWDSDFWGWVHLIGGAIMVAAGLGLFMRRAWGVYTVVALAGLSAMWNFFLIPFYPFAMLLIIGVDVLLIWAVTRPGTGIDEWA